ncbi:MAG: hypothetical protein JW818_11340 [Pirellulales bacterium]|nr:hypothetical protein [Pirellulales bacterium]
MEALIRLLQGTAGKLLVAVAILSLLGGLGYGLYGMIAKSDEDTKTASETPSPKATMTMGKMRGQAMKPAKRPAFKSGTPTPTSMPAADPAALANRPKDGDGPIRHRYKIRPFGQVSFIRAQAEGDKMSAQDAQAAAAQLSRRLVFDADRFQIWFFDDDTSLERWDGKRQLDQEDVKHCLWTITTNRRGNSFDIVAAVPSTQPDLPSSNNPPGK